jgi:spermidine synthase
LLIELAILGNFRPKFIGNAMLLVSMVVSTLLLSGNKNTATESIEILQQMPSFYGQLQVISIQGEKSLLVDGIGQNYVLDNDIYTTAYINFIAALPELRHKPVAPGDKALVIGLGAGQLPMLLQRSGLVVDAVEIDPKVGELAQAHFDFALPRSQIHYMDGRLFLLRNQDAFEYIVIDAFSAEQIASHLVSQEALMQAKARLTDTGVLAINVTSVTSGEDIAALQHTLQSVFPAVRTFGLDAGDALTSIVFLASTLPVHVSTGNTSLPDSPLDDANPFIAGELPDLDGHVLLTDDYNPIAHQRKQVQLLWRDAMIDYLGEQNLVWLIY